MDSIKKNWILSFCVAILVGVGLYYGERILSYLISPVVVAFANQVLTPSPNEGVGTLIAFNFFLTVFAGILVSTLAAFLLCYFLRCKTMLYPLVTSLGFLVSSYWWFLIDPMEAVVTVPAEGMAILLGRPLVIGCVFLLITRFLMVKMSPNKSLQPTANGGG